MKIFYHLLANSILATVTNSFTWFGLTYWIYLQTESVLSTSIMGGIFLILTSLSGFWLGSIVDHHKKKTAMLLSSGATLVFFISATLVYLGSPLYAFTTVASMPLWIMVVLVLLGATAGNLRNIALPTVTTLLVEPEKRDRANGMIGMVMGLSFAGASIGSGLTLGFSTILTIFLIAITTTIMAIFHLTLLPIKEEEMIHTEEKPKKIDIKGTIEVIKTIPGLFPLIFFTTFNNFLGGAFMALMDAYGLSLVSVQTWGLLWGILSLGFIAGGMYIAKKGLGNYPLKNLFLINIVLWTVTILFPLQPSITLLSLGMAIYVCLAPFIEATEQTIIQKVVPFERQGRVFGFAQSVEMAASPITAFLIGPIAQYIFIPFMTTGAGVALIGDWFGVGIGRGIALVFILTGIIGLIVTLIARESKSY
ncbi:MFS transporter, partial [bacterium]|nr:MFS transporter [bacterium]